MIGNDLHSAKIARPHPPGLCHELRKHHADQGMFPLPHVLLGVPLSVARVIGIIFPEVTVLALQQHSS